MFWRRTFERDVADGNFPYPDRLNVVMTGKKIENKWGDVDFMRHVNVTQLKKIQILRNLLSKNRTEVELKKLTQIPQKQLRKNLSESEWWIRVSEEEYQLSERGRQFAEENQLVPLNPAPAKSATKNDTNPWLLEKKPIDRLGQGLHNGVFYYGTETPDGFQAVITSERKYYRVTTEIGTNEKGKKFEYLLDRIKKEFGLNYRHNFSDEAIEYPWASRSITAYLEGSYKPLKLKNLYEIIYKQNNWFIDHVDARTHSYLTCWIIASYGFSLFESFGRLYFPAEKGSGKSKQSRILKLTAFNAMWITKGSESSLMRDIESTCGTPIIDNFDKLNDELKNRVYHLIETGLYPDAKHRLTNPNTLKTTGFKTYSGLAINNILGLDQNTQDKTFVTPMLKTQGEKRKRTPNPKDSVWGGIRDSCRYWWLDNFTKVIEKIKELDIDDLEGRELDVSFPVLVIANMVGKGVFDEVCSLVQERCKEESTQDLETNWEYHLFLVIDRILGEGQIEFLQLKDLTDSLVDTLFPGLDVEKRNAKINSMRRWISKKLTSIPYFRTKKLHKGCTVIKFSRLDVDKYMSLRGFKQQEETVISNNDQTTLPTSTNSTNSTNVYSSLPEVELGRVGRVGRDKKRGIQKMEEILNFCKEPTHIDSIKGVFGSDSPIDELLKEGKIYEVTPGMVKKV